MGNYLMNDLLLVLLKFINFQDYQKINKSFMELNRCNKIENVFEKIILNILIKQEC